MSLFAYLTLTRYINLILTRAILLQVERYINNIAEDIRSFQDDISTSLKRLHENGQDTNREVKKAREEQNKVADILSKITATELRQPITRKESPLDEERKQVLLNSLRFDQIDTRQMTIKIAHAKTCKWLLGNPKYLDWLNPSKLVEHHGFLWIKGKPGTGKSTLIKLSLPIPGRR